MQQAEADLADVERVLAVPGRAGVAVGDDELGARRAVADRPHPAAVLVADLVQDETLALVEADAQTPLLPAHLPAVDLEARALGLDDLERTQVVAQRTHCVGGVVPGRPRDGHLAVILDPDHLHRLQVDDRMETPDGMRVGIVVAVMADPHGSPGEPQVTLLLRCKVTERPELDVEEIEILDAACGESVPEGRVGLHGRDALLDLGEDHWRLHTRYRPPGAHRPRGHREHRLVRLTGDRVVDDGERLALRGPPRVEREHGRFRWLVERDAHDPVRVAHLAFRAEQLDGDPKLVGAQRVERMRHVEEHRISA